MKSAHKVYQERKNQEETEARRLQNEAERGEAKKTKEKEQLQKAEKTHARLNEREKNLSEDKEKTNGKFLTAQLLSSQRQSERKKWLPWQNKS